MNLTSAQKLEVFKLARASRPTGKRDSLAFIRCVVDAWREDTLKLSFTITRDNWDEVNSLYKRTLIPSEKFFPCRSK